MRAELPAQVVELVDAFRNPITQIEFLYLLANANILEPVLVDAETAARMVRPYSWFLDRVSPEGIKRLHPRRGRLAKPRWLPGDQVAGPGHRGGHAHHAHPSRRTRPSPARPGS